MNDNYMIKNKNIVSRLKKNACVLLFEEKKPTT